jgi:hypothetical protein
MFKYGGPNGFLDLFNNGGGSFAQQYKYTDAPDADARLVQAAYLADTFAKAQGKQAAISGTLANAAKLGDYLRYSMFDKYFKQISAACSQDGSVSCPAGTGKANEDTYLMSWYFAWGGATTGAWSWRISGTTIHEGYQNPVAAYALSTDSSLIPLSPTAKADWATSLTTQLNLFQWLQSAQGAIAGGITNNWGGNYGDVSSRHRATSRSTACTTPPIPSTRTRRVTSGSGTRPGRWNAWRSTTTTPATPRPRRSWPSGSPGPSRSPRSIRPPARSACPAR